jgi:hypothetical protein
MNRHKAGRFYFPYWEVIEFADVVSRVNWMEARDKLFEMSEKFYMLGEILYPPAAFVI